MSEPGATTAFSKSEMMIVAAARALEGQRVCFVGVGLPNIAVNLAQRTVAPDLEMVYEAGVFGARPSRLPLSIGDPSIVTGSTAVVSMLELFGYYLQGGLIDVGFLGAAQIDRFGNINTTVIGDYAHPTTRLPGSGGACEIAINARQVFVIMRQSARSFVDRIDFRTSPGNLGGAEEAERIRREGGWLGRGPTVVVTDLGIYHFDDAGEMRLDSLHPGFRRFSGSLGNGWFVGLPGPINLTLLVGSGLGAGGAIEQEDAHELLEEDRQSLFELLRAWPDAGELKRFFFGQFQNFIPVLLQKFEELHHFPFGRQTIDMQTTHLESG